MIEPGTEEGGRFGNGGGLLFVPTVADGSILWPFAINRAYVSEDRPGGLGETCKVDGLDATAEPAACHYGPDLSFLAACISECRMRADLGESVEASSQPL